MAKASDNVFPKLIVSEGATPSSPSAGQQKLFIDSADHKLKRVDSAGTVATIEGGGSGGGGGSFVPSQIVLPYSSATTNPFITRTDVGTWTTYNSFTNPIGGGGVYNSSAAVGDSIAFTFYIDPGTYEINVYGAFDNGRGIVTYEVEDAAGAGTFTSLGTIDWYAAAASGFNTLKSLTALTIGGTSGWRKLRCRVSGKNASSSANSEFLQALQLRRTA